jgi:hypothetical protein
MTTTAYVAFRSSDSLHQLTDGFIRRMRDPAARPEPDVVEKIMTTFIDEALQAFFLRPADLSALSSTQKRLVRIATDTISKATRLVIGRSVRKMDLEQNRAAAEYMDDIRLPGPDHAFWYVAFPISAALAAQGHRLEAMAREGNIEAARDEMVRYLRGVTDQALIWYFDKPIALLRFGPILRKIAAVGVDTTRKASYGVINKVIPKLDAEQFVRSAQYYQSMRIHP